MHPSAGFCDEALMVRMAAEAEAQIAQFSQQNLANLAWAYGKLSFYQRSLMDAVALQAVIKVKARCSTSSPYPETLNP